MNEIAITKYMVETFPGIDVQVATQESGAPEVAWGDTFFFYDPERSIPADRRLPFATLVTKDYGDFDCASNLNRPGIFRLNIGIGKATFMSLFHADAAGIPDSTHDFTALDKVMPHPVYGKMFWICVLNPSAETFKTVQPLLSEAYALATRKYAA
jgi:hypothetical protein